MSNLPAAIARRIAQEQREALITIKRTNRAGYLAYVSTLSTINAATISTLAQRGLIKFTDWASASNPSNSRGYIARGFYFNARSSRVLPACPSSK